MNSISKIITNSTYTSTFEGFLPSILIHFKYMAGFIRKFIGSSSGGSRRNEENDEIDNDDDEGVQTFNPETDNMQIILSQNKPDGKWWSDKCIKKYVSWSFTNNISDEEYFTKWSEASQAQRLKMWNWFRKHVKSVDKEYNPKPDWQKEVTRRITKLINGLKYLKNKPDWVPLSWWVNLKEREEKDPEFAKNSKINKANRMSGAKDGKALGTHTLGRKSCSDAFKELGESATPYKLFTKTKKNKKGEWVNPRATKTDAIYQEEMSQPTPPGEAPDEYRSFYKAVDGFDNRERFFGHGDVAAEQWYERPCNKGTRRSFSYTPTQYTQFATQINNERAAQQSLEEEMRATQETVRLQAQQMVEMKQAMAEMRASQPPPSCSGFARPFRREDNEDGGHGFGSDFIEPLGNY
ncbi:uncharacterized protein LOC141612317 [Silene latifolia]|uniref:uncharacterized protein LOC141612317 n=1 Tax=Silene latifolia TaxID=37657 RepID=UPI003D77B206